MRRRIKWTLAIRAALLRGRCAVLKWTGAGLCALIFAAWFASRWFEVSISHRRSSVARDVVLGRGALELMRIDWGDLPTRIPDGWSVEHCSINAPCCVWL